MLPAMMRLPGIRLLFVIHFPYGGDYNTLTWSYLQYQPIVDGVCPMRYPKLFSQIKYAKHLALLLLSACLIFIPVLTWAYIQTEVDGGSDSGLTWYQISTIVFTLILFWLSAVSASPQARIKTGFLRLSMHVKGELGEKRFVSGLLMGEEAGKYRQQGYLVLLYAKSDIWYIDSADGTGLKLGPDGSWGTESQNNRATMYAAFLAKEDYQPDRTILKPNNADLPPLPVDGEQVVTWMLWAIDNSPLSGGSETRAVYWLTQQITPNDIAPNPLPERSGLILSYQVPEAPLDYHNLRARSWLYDNALAAIGLIIVGRLPPALIILNALSGQMFSDGKFSFCFDVQTGWYSQDYRSGTLAWTGYAFIYYQRTLGDAHFQPIVEQIAHYLLSLQDLNPHSSSFGSIRTSPADYSYHTDQNIIIYFFLRDLGRISQKSLYTEQAELVKKSLLQHHWQEEPGHLTYKIGDVTPGLVEETSLGALFFLALDNNARAQCCITHCEKIYQIGALDERPYGFSPYPDKTTIWSQASLQMALVYKRTGNLERGERLITEITGYQDIEGGIPYAKPETAALTGEVYYEWPSIAGTSWLLIAKSSDDDFLGK
jgi:hypothetical protein